VAAVRSDNGGEFVEMELAAFFAARGVNHELSASYKPQQNGKAERLNRSLEDRVYRQFYGAALSCTVALRTEPQSRLQTRTPKLRSCTKIG
jgi:transposase InsO family protein